MTESDKKVIGDSDVILYEFLLRGQEVDKVCPWVPLVPARPKRGGDWQVYTNICDGST